MLSTNTNPAVTGQSTITVDGVTKTAATFNAQINSQNKSISITLIPGDQDTLTATANNATTQADVSAFMAKVLQTAGDAGMTYYGAPSTAAANS